ncbi:pyruvate kinase [Thermopirellula anaerolimosa]
MSFPVRPSQTKIVATLGPASETPEMVRDMIRAGVDVFRLNAAHGTLDDHQRRLQTVRQAEAELGRPVAVLLDLAGPKIRLGDISGGSLECHLNDVVPFVKGATATKPGELSTTFPPILDDLEAGDRVLLADGLVELQVIGTSKDAVKCRVVQPGVVRSRQGLHVPGAKLRVRAMDDADFAAAEWAALHGIDFVGLSFVRSAEDIDELRDYLKSHGSDAHIIAKIEKAEALDRLDEIIGTADGVMVARGDLGVETDIARLAVAQKQIVNVANRHRKPVIVATQMLDSMQNSPLPTRAEVTDVANAVLDGADACMLSGETAIGRFPLESVAMMHRIALAAEEYVRSSGRVVRELSAHDVPGGSDASISESTALHAGCIAAEVEAKLLIVATHSGKTALRISKHRFSMPTVGVSGNPAVLRRMALYWGIIPLPQAPVAESDRLLEFVARWGVEQQLVQSGDLVVAIYGTGLPDTKHNGVLVQRVSDADIGEDH